MNILTVASLLSKKKVSISLFLPLIWWLWLNQGIFTRGFFLGSDNLQYYYWITYYAQQLSHGVYPLWNPFHAWGSLDNFDMLFMGPFNPIYLLMALGMCLPVDPYVIYVTVLLFYMLLGYGGVYLLARKVLDGHWWGWIVYVLFLFSGFGSVVFTQLVVLFMFVPTVWFFLFLIELFQTKDHKKIKILLAGASFTLAVALNSYVPVFFIFLFISFICSLMLIRCPSLGFKTIGRFILQEPWIVIACVLGILLSLLPDLMWSMQSASREYVLMVDRANSQSSNPAEVSLDLAMRSNLAVAGSWEELFTDFESAHNFYIFIPLQVLLLISMFTFIRFVRWQGVVFFWGLIIFLFGLTDATPLYGFLVKHIYVFRLFRNYFFFIPFINLLIIFFVAGQLKTFMQEPMYSFKKRVYWTTWALVSHGIVSLYLSRLGGVPSISFITLLLSACWFLAWIWMGTCHFRTRAVVILGAISLLQSAYVLPLFGSLIGSIESPTIVRDIKFSYLRPTEGGGFNEQHGFHKRQKQFLDESGFVQSGYMGTRWSYDVHSKLPKDVTREYVRHKFILYDCTAYMDPSDPKWDLLSMRLKALNNIAFVSRLPAVSCSGQVTGQALAINGASRLLKVERFDVNSIEIETNFPTRKFLVYNDSYHPLWQAKIDGQQTVVEEANFAFKGLWVEAGQHKIVLSLGGFLFSWTLLVSVWFFTIWFIMILVLYKPILESNE